LSPDESVTNDAGANVGRFPAPPCGTPFSAGYLLGSDLFIKRASAQDPRKQPDFGCSYETFTNEQFLEMETLGPLNNVQPGGSVEHSEHWTLHKNIKISSWTDQEIDRVFLPLK
jgi:hypothetical protein